MSKRFNPLLPAGLDDIGDGGASLDEKAKVSANDTTAGYLNGKLVAGAYLDLTEVDDGGNETLVVQPNWAVAVPAYETDPFYSANLYAVGMDQYVGQSDNVTFGQLNVTGQLASINGAPLSWPGANAAGQLTNDGAGNLSWAAAQTPGGSDTQVQFNDGGAFGGDPLFAWDTARKRLAVSDADGNVKIGDGAGENVAAGAADNLYLGHQAGYSDAASTSAASFNLGGGSYALWSNVGGNNNVAIGATALYANTDGSDNGALGVAALAANTTGNGNLALGGSALGGNATGNYNVAVGGSALRGVTATDNNIGLGYFAGRYASANNELYINNQDRLDAAGDRSQSIIYGVMGGSAAAQSLALNVSSLAVGNASTGSDTRLYGSYGATLVPALSTGNWTLGTGWTFGTSPARIIKSADGTGTCTQTGGTAPTAGTLYRVTLTVTGWSVGSFTWTFGGNGNGGAIAANGTYTYYVQALNATRLVATPTGTSRFTLSAVAAQAVTLGSLTAEGTLAASRFSSPAGLFQSTVPFGTDVATPRMEFYARDGNTGYPANSTVWWSWYADVNSQKTQIMKLYAADATTWGLQGQFFIAPSAIKSSAGSGGSVTVQYAYLLFAQAGNNLWLDVSKADNNSGLNCQTKMANGATAYGYQFDTLNAFSTAGAKLAKFLNAGAEKASIDKDGGFAGLGLISNRLTTKQQQWEFDAANYANITVGSTGGVTFDAVGSGASFTFSDKVIAGDVVRLKSYTVATLPAGTQGDTAYVTDALAPTFLGVVVGGGAVVTPVFYNGAVWVAG